MQEERTGCRSAFGVPRATSTSSCERTSAPISTTAAQMYRSYQYQINAVLILCAEFLFNGLLPKTKGGAVQRCRQGRAQGEQAYCTLSSRSVSSPFPFLLSSGGLVPVAPRAVLSSLLLSANCSCA
jgi:hypothetical protein